jgi:DNA polymerase-1
VVSDKLLERLLVNKDIAFFSKKLATIRKDVPIKLDISHSEWKKHVNQEELKSLFKEYGFFSLSKRLGELFSGAESELKLPLAETGKINNHEVEKDTGRTLELFNAGNDFIFSLEDQNLFFTLDGKKVGQINLSEPRKNSDSWEKLKSIFSDPNKRKSGYNLKPQMKYLKDLGLKLEGRLFDVKIAAWLLNPDMRDHSLERIYTNEFELDLEADQVGQVLAIFKLTKRLEDYLKGRGLIKVFEDIEMPLMPVLMEMELTGIKIDSDSISDISKTVNKEISQLESQIFKYAGTNFNINSPSQLSEILFNKIGIKGKVKKTSKGAISTAAGELEKLVDEHPVIDLILKYREVQKLKTTYIEPFPKLINSETGRIHTTYNQDGSATGRLSSQDPNLQNIPVRTELGQEFRKAFVSRPGSKLVSFDYTQLELRIAAHIAKDAKMIAAFKRGEDIHTRTAAEIFNVEPKAVTPQMRRQAKVMNFGLIYGMGILGFQRASGVNREKAREFIDAYMSEFSGIAKYMIRIKEEAKKRGYVETLFGRKRLLPEIKSGVPMLVAQAERIAINMPIQGTEADFMKIAMINCQKYIDQNFKEEEVKMLLQVHDELVFEVKNNLVEPVAKEITKIMENVYKMEVPLTVEAKAGDNWRDMELL